MNTLLYRYFRRDCRSPASLVEESPSGKKARHNAQKALDTDEHSTRQHRSSSVSVQDEFDPIIESVKPNGNLSSNIDDLQATISQQLAEINELKAELALSTSKYTAIKSRNTILERKMKRLQSKLHYIREQVEDLDSDV